MKKINIFIFITFLLTWTMAFGLMFSSEPINPSTTTLIFMLCMFMPALGAILTTVVTKGKLKDLWIKPNIKNNKKYYLISWLLPIFLIIIGFIVYFLLIPSHFDPSMRDTIESSKAQLSALGSNIPSDSQIRKSILMQLPLAVILAPIANFLPCLGEELGWRGFLLPNLMEKYSITKSTIISGIIWGIWHAPMIAMGHNYGLGYKFYPITGILAMIVFCVVVGTFLSYITIKTHSCIPAVITHAIINGFAASGLVFLSKSNLNPFIGPAPTGIIGGIGFIVVGIICFKYIKDMDSKNSEINI